MAWQAVQLLFQQEPHDTLQEYEVGWYPVGQLVPQVLYWLPQLGWQVTQLLFQQEPQETLQE